MSKPKDSKVKSLNYPVISIGDAAEKTASNTQRICLIGVDALNWDILDVLLKNGDLPVISKLIDSGSRGTFNSLRDNMYSPAIWTTVASGFHPKQHGIEFF